MCKSKCETSMISRAEVSHWSQVEDPWTSNQVEDSELMEKLHSQRECSWKQLPTLNNQIEALLISNCFTSCSRDSSPPEIKLDLCFCGMLQLPTKQTNTVKGTSYYVAVWMPLLVKVTTRKKLHDITDAQCMGQWSLVQPWWCEAQDAVDPTKGRSAAPLWLAPSTSPEPSCPNISGKKRVFSKSVQASFACRATHPTLDSLKSPK